MKRSFITGINATIIRHDYFLPKRFVINRMLYCQKNKADVLADIFR